MFLIAALLFVGGCQFHWIVKPPTVELTPHIAPRTPIDAPLLPTVTPTKAAN